LPARATDGLAASVVFVVGGDVADGLVQAYAVVVGADTLQLAVQLAGVADGAQVGSFGLDVSEEAFDRRLVSRSARSAEVTSNRV
jgi:hypothetical protein